MPLEGSLESSGLGKGWTTSQNKDATSSYEEKTTRHTYQRRRRLFKGPTKVPERERILNASQESWTTMTLPAKS